MNVIYLLLNDKVENLIPHDSTIIKSDQNNLDLKLADLSLKLDEQIYLEKYKVDVVFVVKGTEPLEIYTVCLPDTLYFLSTLSTGSFYCTPEVISIISTVYKFNFKQLNLYNFFFSDNILRNHTNKMLHILDKTGLNIYVR